MNTRLFRPYSTARVTFLPVLAVAMFLAGGALHAQTPAPRLMDPNLAVRTAPAW